MLFWLDVLSLDRIFNVCGMYVCIGRPCKRKGVWRSGANSKYSQWQLFQTHGGRHALLGPDHQSSLDSVFCIAKSHGSGWRWICWCQVGVSWLYIILIYRAVFHSLREPNRVWAVSCLRFHARPSTLLIIIIFVTRYTRHLPESDCGCLVVVVSYTESFLMTTLVYQSRDYHVYIPNTYQTRPVSSWKTPLI